MSDLDKLFNSLPKDFKLDISKMPGIVATEKKYNHLGGKRLDRLIELSGIKPTGGEQSFFILGYSECGQDLDEKLKLAHSIIEKLEKALNSISSYDKNDGNSPSDNTGPSSMQYWRWQEMISRNIANDTIDEVKEMKEQI